MTIDKTSSDVVVTPEGTQFRCYMCNGLFLHQDIRYVPSDFGYTQICETCCKKPQAQSFLPFFDRLARGLVSNDEIANFNAIHDM